VGAQGIVGAMTSKVRTVTFDTHDPYTLASFWATVLNGKLADDDFPGDPAATVTAGALTLLYWQNPDSKSVKNRLHLDLEPDGSRDAEVEWLLSLGATIADDRRSADKLEPGAPPGTGFVVMLDPEGNEFCVLCSAAERAAIEQQGDTKPEVPPLRRPMGAGDPGSQPQR
jgi:hypothetical protein